MAIKGGQAERHESKLRISSTTRRAPRHSSNCCFNGSNACSAASLALAFVATLLFGLLWLQKVAGLQLHVMQACRRDTLHLLGKDSKTGKVALPPLARAA